MAKGLLIQAGMTTTRAGSTRGAPARRKKLPSDTLKSVPSRHTVNRLQAAVIRDLIRLDVAEPQFETEGLALIRSFLKENG